LAAIPTGLTSAANATLSVEWYNNAAGNPDRLADQLQLLYYDETQKSPVFLGNMGQRADAAITVTVPPYMSGKMVHVWIAFLSQDEMEASLSAYAGSVQIT